MPAYKHALRVSNHSTEQHLLQAAEFLDRCDGTVVFEGIAVLRCARHEILCEVIDPTPGAHRCAEEFKVLMENAQRALAKSRLAILLPNKRLRWRMMDDENAV